MINNGRVVGQAKRVRAVGLNEIVEDVSQRKRKSKQASEQAAFGVFHIPLSIVHGNPTVPLNVLSNDFHQVATAVNNVSLANDRDRRNSADTISYNHNAIKKQVQENTLKLDRVLQTVEQIAKVLVPGYVIPGPVIAPVNALIPQQSSQLPFARQTVLQQITVFPEEYTNLKNVQVRYLYVKWFAQSLSSLQIPSGKENRGWYMVPLPHY
jgi:hypothetical protein